MIRFRLIFGGKRHLAEGLHTGRSRMDIRQLPVCLIRCPHHAQLSLHERFIQIDGCIRPMVIVILLIRDCSQVTDAVLPTLIDAGDSRPVDDRL